MRINGNKKYKCIRINTKNIYKQILKMKTLSN